MKLPLLNKVPKATWAGLATGTVIALGSFAYVVIKQPPPQAAVLPAATYSPDPTESPSVSPSPTATVSPSPKPLPATPVRAKASTRRIANAANKLIKAYAPQRNGLLNNEYAYFDPSDPASVLSPDWNMTSGSLFGRGSAYWTGKPDSCEPDAKSTRCTNSDVFRLDSKLKFSDNLSVSLSLMQLTDIHNSSCNASDSCWHGTHIWLRYQTEYNLYYASVNRADGQVVLKRKVPCGTDNDGTYFVLGSYVPHNFKTGLWNHYKASIQTNPDKSVTLKLYDTDISSVTPVTTGTDRGGINPKWTPDCQTPGHYPSSAYAPITTPGGIGIRGDYAEFLFQDLKVSRL